MKQFVTGGAGFLGSHLCEELINRGYEVVCVDSLITGSMQNLAQFLGRPEMTFLGQDVSSSVDVPGVAMVPTSAPVAPLNRWTRAAPGSETA